HKLKRDVLAAFYHLSYAKHKEKTYKYLDSLYRKFASAAERRFDLGETNYLEMISAKSKQKQLETLHKQSLQDIIIAQKQLQKVTQTDSLSIISEPMQKLELKTISINSNVGLSYFEEHKTYYEALNQKAKQSLLSDISVEYFQGSNSLMNQNLIGYQFGVKIPLLFNGNASKIKASKIATEVIETQQEDYKTRLDAEHQTLLAKLNQYEDAISYYETQGKHLSEEITKTAVSS